MFGVTLLIFIAGIFCCVFRLIKGEYSVWGGPAFILTFIGVFMSVVALMMPGDASVSAPLDTLNDGSSVSGRFFLGSGYIDSEPSFMFYVSDNGSHYLLNVPADSATVRYTSGRPHADLVCRGSHDSLFTWPLHIHSSPDCQRHVRSAIFYVPKDSIVSNYHLDGK